MPLLNYTTDVPASKSVGEIMRILQDGGASKIMLENGPNREITAVSFLMETSFGPLPFQLPANVPMVIVTINAQIKEENQKVNQGRRYKRKIPQRLFNDKDQAERIAWRIAKDWLEAQIAISTIGSARLEQIMMPFAVINGKSFYQHMIERGSLALPAPKDEPREAVQV